MDFTPSQAAKIAAICMIAVVVTQLLYMLNRSAELGISSIVIWTIEAAVFLGLTLFALVALVRSAGLHLAWAAIGMGGLLNVIQVGMGLTMFGPLRDAGEALAPAYQAIVAGAFFFYFAGKFLFGIAAIVFGAALMKGPVGARITGALAVLSGLAAVGLNLGAMAMGMDLMFAAGAAGTIATVMAAFGALVTVGRPNKLG